jgi:hypothetical protein
MTLDKVKVYLDGKMVVFATENDVLIASVPPGQFRIKPTDGDGFAFEDLVNNKTIAAVKDYDDVLNAAGATYGANQAAVLTALNAFAGFNQGGGGAILTNFYAPSQYHLMTGEGGKLANVFATPANSFYVRKIKVLDNISVTGLTIEVTAGLVGNAVAGVYSLNDVGLPSNLLFQINGEFDLSVTGIQEVALVDDYELSAGAYAVAYHASGAATTRSISRPVPTWGQSKTSIAGENSWIQQAAAYNATMPSSFPTSTVSVSVTQAAAVLFSLV